jgi:hypothetical protein
LTGKKLSKCIYSALYRQEREGRLFEGRRFVITFVNPASPFLVDEGVMPTLGLKFLASTLFSKGIKARTVDIGLGEEVPDGELLISETACVTPKGILPHHRRPILIRGTLLFYI